MTNVNRRCPDGHPASGDETYCRTCGAAFDARPSFSSPRRCVNGHAAASDVRFCRICGAQIVDGTNRVGTRPVASASLASTTDQVRDAPGAHGAADGSSTLQSSSSDLRRAQPGFMPPPASSQRPFRGSDRDAPPDATRSDSDVELRDMEPRARRRRNRWLVPVGAGVLSVLIIGLIAELALKRDTAAVACEPGVAWEQRPTNRPEGTPLLTGTQAGIVHGGALIGFPNQQEAAAMGHVSDFVQVTQREFDSIDRVPRQGLLFRERSIPGAKGRYFYSAGGAVYQVRDLRSLSSLSIRPRDAIVIPIDGLDGARRVPPSGTLIRVHGAHKTWAIDGGSRRRARHVCNGARTVALPRDRNLLAAIPLSR